MRVEQLALRGGAQERLVGVLAVQVDQPFARIFQLRERGGVAVDEAARAAGAVDRAAQHQLARIAGQVALLEPGGHRFGNFEFAGELGALGTLAHHGGVAPAADQELDRVDEDRFAGARFTGEDAEPLAQLERSAVDQDEVADFERS